MLNYDLIKKKFEEKINGNCDLNDYFCEFSTQNNLKIYSCVINCVFCLGVKLLDDENFIMVFFDSKEDAESFIWGLQHSMEGFE